MSADDHGNREARRRFSGDDHAVPHHEKTAEAGYLCEIMQRTRSRRGVYFRIDERLTPRRRLRGIKRIRFLQHTGVVPDCSAKDGFSFFRLFLPPVATISAARCHKKLTNLSAVRRRAGEYADGAPSVPRRRPD